MERIHESLPIREFALPDSVEKASVCSITGLRATSSCPTTSELFAKDDLPDDYCSGHVVETPEEEETDETDDSVDGDNTGGNTTEPETPTTPETPTEPTPPPTQPETPTDPNTQNPPAQ